ncbi:hypothetical protein LTR35_015298 [Friedmanniomyces endolithicus]|uniref:PIN domain-containing protein n=1 Tax=Friedmanniomyces endolithicus TaxID=329885 RepID=A0AAN6J6S4_9PEZI|nr:hypothetical protein LTR35_015298 [Friedmanniomyces endolithicus]KAK0289232.1 hypothetical protein LTS00_009151 [Friedmanniomyces endolithicus]KAK0309600.1 hypothetical protein LTR82_015088 [Friedmanniomyces endolithicus]
MRAGARSRPVSHHGPQTPYAPAQAAAVQPTRKVFNCIVDDSALVAGVKRSTRNGIRQWVKNGHIRLFVPLHALEQLSRQKSAGNRHGEDVRETLQWLDDATSKYPNAVTLQGGDQYYQNWAEVDRFVVPRTLFSEQDHIDDEEMAAPADDTARLSLYDDRHTSPVSSANSIRSGAATISSTQSVRSSVSLISPPTSPAKAASSPVKPTAIVAAIASPALTESARTPIGLQPLFNYILWRLHQELEPVAALESFIFLCNDPQKAHYAKGFDIRCKRLEQLREAVSREDRDFRNRTNMLDRENTQSSEPSLADLQHPNDDNEVVYKPPPRGPAAIMPQPPISIPNVIDPNAFGPRTPVLPTPPRQQQKPEMTILPTPKSPRFTSTAPARGGPYGGLNGGSNGGFAPRGNITPRGNNNFRGGRGGRGNFAPPGRAGFAPVVRAPESSQVGSSGQIDPDSFSRPRSGGFAGRGGRKLWVPGT